jgi:DNA-binding CsgD family transcriptional regulator
VGQSLGALRRSLAAAQQAGGASDSLHLPENRALAALARTLADSPRDILPTLAESILDVTESDSAGLSLLTIIDGEERFYWPAIAGVWQPHINGGTPRNFGPCGDVLDADAPLLFRHPERRYTYLRPVMPPAVECLLVPFQVRGESVGTLWALTHDDHRQFDAEDLRLIRALGQFASAAYEVLLRLGDVTYPEHAGSAPSGVPAAAYDTSAADKLSPRERECLALLVAGHSYQETARRLSLTVKTVETYRRRLMRKLDISNRAELVAFAVRTGILAGLDADSR